jgi:hypothetical protein
MVARKTTGDFFFSTTSAGKGKLRKKNSEDGLFL